MNDVKDIMWYINSGYWFWGDFCLTPENKKYTTDLVSLESPVFFKRESRDPNAFRECRAEDNPLYAVEEKFAADASFFDDVNYILNHLVLYEDYKDLNEALEA